MNKKSIEKGLRLNELIQKECIDMLDNFNDIKESLEYLTRVLMELENQTKGKVEFSGFYNGVKTFAEQIEEFSVYAYPYPKGNRILVYKGFTVGHKHICKFPNACTQRLEVVIEKEITAHEMKNIEVLYVQ